MNTPPFADIIGCILLCETAGIVGSLTTTIDSPWYRALNKPSFYPPGWIFTPVWIFLYAVMGISLALLLRGWPASRAAIIVFAVQLLLNAIWTPIFFGLHSIAGALITIILMWFAIVATIIAAYPISAWSAGLLLPYLAWVTFAVILNAAFFRLN